MVGILDPHGLEEAVSSLLSPKPVRARVGGGGKEPEEKRGEAGEPPPEGSAES